MTKNYDWNEIFSAGVEIVRAFAEGRMSVHDFRRTSTSARHLVSTYPSPKSRQLARAALARRERTLVCR